MAICLDFDWQTNEFMLYCRITQLRKSHTQPGATPFFQPVAGSTKKNSCHKGQLFQLGFADYIS